uniref:Uncharacterized protein n=1 Tax=Cacopsylla melanoneura TaxID=428564 RepID=A0A8D8X9Q9_9HEMI
MSISLPMYCFLLTFVSFTGIGFTTFTSVASLSTHIFNMFSTYGFTIIFFTFTHTIGLTSFNGTTFFVISNASCSSSNVSFNQFFIDYFRNNHSGTVFIFTT